MVNQSQKYPAKFEEYSGDTQPYADSLQKDFQKIVPRMDTDIMSESESPAPTSLGDPTIGQNKSDFGDSFTLNTDAGIEIPENQSSETPVDVPSAPRSDEFGTIIV